jgi:formylglycine-generating enzyme required for sulfatase activity
LAAGNIYRDCDVCPQMVVIPAGRFKMGSDVGHAEERPAHAVVIARPFAIGIHEISVDEWDACLREGGCRQSPAQGLQGKMPMADVSWDDAQQYVSWLSAKTGKKYRLPTEAEWEYAARAGTATRFWWGEAQEKGRANCADCGGQWGGKSASPVGSFEANPYGLYDVHGNVWEWTEDCWNPSYSGAPGDGTPRLRGDCIARVLRGGSWALDHEYMRASRRSRYDRDVRYYLNGFRVVCELPYAESADLPFVVAVQDAVDKVFSKVQPASGAERPTLAIDPLIDGVSGMQSQATRSMGSQIADRLRNRYPQFDIREFSAADADRLPFVVIGTFTGVNKERMTTGERVAYRICLSLLDVKSGKVASKARVFSQADGVDVTPTAFFRDSPAWVPDRSVQAYIDTCQATKPGDPIDPMYLDRLEAAALIGEAIDQYEKGDYRRSHALFSRAVETKGGDQLRSYNGLYLSSWGLGQHQQATAEFATLVNFGLDRRRLAIKFPFRPNSTDFLLDERAGSQPDLWLAQIARETARRADCLEIVGHTARGGTEMLNERLSARRAEYVMRRLAAEVPALRDRMIATGRGAADNLIGSATNDGRDGLDHRIEFDPIECTRATPKQG